jgi:hypothetical protein
MKPKKLDHGPPLVTREFISEPHKLVYGFDGQKVFYMPDYSGLIFPGTDDPNFVPKGKISGFYPKAAIILKKDYQKKVQSPKARLI